jgi:hypothetical protein
VQTLVRSLVAEFGAVRPVSAVRTPSCPGKRASSLDRRPR